MDMVLLHVLSKVRYKMEIEYIPKGDLWSVLSTYCRIGPLLCLFPHSPVQCVQGILWAYHTLRSRINVRGKFWKNHKCTVWNNFTDTGLPWQSWPKAKSEIFIPTFWRKILIILDFQQTGMMKIITTVQAHFSNLA